MRSRVSRCTAPAEDRGSPYAASAGVTLGVATATTLCQGPSPPGPDPDGRLPELKIFDLFATILARFYAVIDSYAIAITMLTLLVMIVATPLTIKGTKSMIKMQRLQPELKKIQARFKDDRERMNAELMGFYRANNINPVGGCLPLLIQAPIFLVLYRVVRGLTQRVTDVGIQAGHTLGQIQAGGGRSGLNYVGDSDRTFDPKYISHSSQLFKDLSVAKQMKSFGVDLSESASSALKTSIPHALPFLALIAVVAVTGFIQQRQIYARTSKSGAQTPVNAQQQMIMKVVPFFLPIFSFGLPAALVVYFVVSNLWRMAQQSYITRALYSKTGELEVIMPPSAEETLDKVKPGGRPSGRPQNRPAGRTSTSGTSASGAPRSAMGRNRRSDPGGSSAGTSNTKR
jgi:YidC/Oxa1 family membrane protein insertase